MEDYVKFLLSKVYKSEDIPTVYIEQALLITIKDVQYHFPEVSNEVIIGRIHQNYNELAIFLFRLGCVLHQNDLENLKFQIHWLLKELCSCELYFNNLIGEGFYIVHGQGTVLGSRNKIGKGFIIHQGCTIGHRMNGFGNGSVIGDNVTMYCNSSILGQLSIGSNVIIGAHVMIKTDIANDKILLNSEISTQKEKRN